MTGATNILVVALILGPTSSANAPGEMHLRVVDLASQSWAKEGLDALVEDAAFFLTGHELGGSDSGGTVGAAFEAASKLFALPEASKAEIVAGSPLPGTSAVRGYLGVGAESGTRASRFECKESLALAGGSISANVAPNRWPQELRAQDVELLEALPQALRAIAMRLAQGLAEEAKMRGLLTHEDSVDCANGGDGLEVLRVFHYLPYEPDRCSGRAPADAELVWSSDHTDWGSLTLIAQADTGGGGLQLFKDGAYKNVLPHNDSLIINGGDWLELVSRGRFRSPLHRVRQPLGENLERTAFVYFHYPADSAPLRPGDIAAAMERQAGGNWPAGLVFNTLTNGLDKLTEPVAFGAHLASKWAGVRSNPKVSSLGEL